MKKTIKYLFLAVTLATTLASCDDMNSVHQKYLDMPETTYIGIPKDVVAKGGLGRVVFDWTLNADPKINSFVIEWNDLSGKSYSEKVDVVAVANSQMSHSLAVPEGSYNFVVYHKSNAGDVSLKTSVSARSYGENYIGTLINRSFDLSATVNGAVFTWAGGDNIVKTTVEYQTSAGATQTITVDAAESSTTIADFKIGGTYKMVTYYTPDGSVDQIACKPETFTFPKYLVGDINKYMGRFNITTRIVPDWSAPTTFGEPTTWGPVTIEPSDVEGYQFKITGLLDPQTKAAVGITDDFAIYCKWRYLESTPQDYIQSPQQSTGVSCTLNGTTGVLFMTHKRTDSPSNGYGNAGWHFNYNDATIYFGQFNNNGQNVLRFCMDGDAGAVVVNYYLPVLTATE